MIEYQARGYQRTVTKPDREQIDAEAAKLAGFGYHVTVWRIGQVIDGRRMPDQYLYEIAPDSKAQVPT